MCHKVIILSAVQGLLLMLSGWISDPGTMPRIGVCVPYAQHDLAREAGFGFIVPGVHDYLLSPSVCLPATTMSVLACNSFLPARLKCVGEEADAEAVVAYADTVFRRAQQRGVSIIVFGSGAARRIPEGYDRSRAVNQFVELCSRLARQASTYGVTIALENLNRSETNLVNTVEEARSICEAVAAPNFGITADIYHMLREGEPAENLLKAGKYIFHCDIAEPAARTPPGVEGTDFTPYLRALKAAGYRGGITIEAGWKNFSAQATVACISLRGQIKRVYR